MTDEPPIPQRPPDAVRFMEFFTPGVTCDQGVHHDAWMERVLVAQWFTERVWVRDWRTRPGDPPVERWEPTL